VDARVNLFEGKSAPRVIVSKGRLRRKKRERKKKGGGGSGGSRQQRAFAERLKSGGGTLGHSVELGGRKRDVL